MKKEKRFYLPAGYRDSMSELDDALEKTSSELKEKKVIITYKNEIDWTETKLNLLFVLIAFVFAYLFSNGNYIVGIGIAVIFATTRTWRKEDKRIELNEDGIPVRVNNMDIQPLLNGEITSIDQLTREQLADFEMAKDLALHLHKVGQIKEKPTEEEMEKEFLRLLNKKLQSQAI